MKSQTIEYFRIRKHIYNLLFNYTNKNIFSFIYDVIIVVIAIFSIIPLMFNQQEIDSNSFLSFIYNNEKTWVIIFTIDYLGKWFTADFKLKKGWKSFIFYPFTFWAILDLIVILPGWLGVSQFQVFVIFRLFKIINFFPKLSEGIHFVFRAIFSEWKILVTITISLLFVVFIGAILIFQIEEAQNTNINNFLDAVWFVFITITTIGYGDIYPVTEVGRTLTIGFALIGIALIALVTATVVSGFNRELEKRKELNELRIKANIGIIKHIKNNLNIKKPSLYRINKETKFKLYFSKLSYKELKELIIDNKELIPVKFFHKIDQYKNDELLIIAWRFLFNEIQINNLELFKKLDKEEMKDLLLKNKIETKLFLSKDKLLYLLEENSDKILWN